MTYSIGLIFDSPESTTSYGISDLFCSDDWTCVDCWNALAESIISLIGSGERNLSQLYPEGHTYVLRNVDINLIGDYDT